MIHRRQFFSALAAAGGLGIVGWSLLESPSRQIRLLSCAQRGSGGYAVLCLEAATGQLQWERELPARGHAIAASPDLAMLAVFARRPGHWVWLLDAKSGHPRGTIQAPARTQFNGHGLFSPDGQQLWVAATSFGSGGQPRGEILCYDRSLGLVGRWASGGLDPHESACVGRHLLIANGGYAEQYGDSAAKSLSADEPPNLAWLDLETGTVTRRQTLTDPKLSIRHLDVGPQGVFVGLQHADGPLASTSLIVQAREQSPLRPIGPPPEGWDAWYGYVLSVQLLPEAGLLLATSPRSGRMGLWDANSGQAIDSWEVADVSGVAGRGSRWWASSGHGHLRDASGLSRRVEQWRFDNHMLALG